MQRKGRIQSGLSMLVSALGVTLLVAVSLFSGSGHALAAEEAVTAATESNESGIPPTKSQSPLALSDQLYPEIGFNPGLNQYLVVWMDIRDVNFDIYGQLLSASGSPTGNNFAISNAIYEQRFAKIAYSPASNVYLVVWDDNRAQNRDIYGQFVSGSSGALIGENFPIAEGANSQMFPELTYSPNGDKFLVTWSEKIGISSNYDVFGRFVSAGGVVDNNLLMIAITGNLEESPSTSYNPDTGMFLLVWTYMVNSNNADLKGRLLNPNGTFEGSVFSIASAPEWQSGSAVTYNPVEKQWFVVWGDSRSDPTSSDAYGRLFSGTGVPQGNEIIIASSTSYESAYGVSYNASAGRYLVTYSLSSGSQTQEVFARLYDGNGTPYAPGFQVQINTPDSYPKRFYPAVAPLTNPAGFMMVLNTWAEPGDNDVWGQRLGHDGRHFGSSFPVAPVPQLLPPPGPACDIQYSDVPLGSTYYDNVRCLACYEVLSGYADGTFKPSNNVTRAQLSKIVSNAAGFNDVPSIQIFQDIPPGSTFYDVIERLAVRGVISGYACNSAPDIPCQPGNKPYFRPNDNATRGQIAKIISEAAGYKDPVSGQTFQDVPSDSAFAPFVERLVLHKVMGGYPCDNNTPGLACVAPGNLPYFKVGDKATRGQISKMVSNTFFPSCVIP